MHVVHMAAGLLLSFALDLQNSDQVIFHLLVVIAAT